MIVPDLRLNALPDHPRGLEVPTLIADKGFMGLFEEIAVDIFLAFKCVFIHRLTINLSLFRGVELAVYPLLNDRVEPSLILIKRSSRGSDF